MKKEEYIYMDCNDVRMSKNNLANILYAAVITRSGLPNSFGVGIYEYNRKQNSFNLVSIKVHIHPSQIEKFETESGFKLREPMKVSINAE